MTDLTDEQLQTELTMEELQQKLEELQLANVARFGEVTRQGVQLNPITFFMQRVNRIVEAMFVEGSRERLIFDYICERDSAAILTQAEHEIRVSKLTAPPMSAKEAKAAGLIVPGR